MSEKVSITKSKLDSLANAIASVGETSVPKTIAQMESAVLELTIPPNLQSKTITPSVTQQIVSPDSGYDAFSQVTVNAIELQEKTITPTTSQQVVTSDTGYDGLSEVTVNAMPSGTAGTPIATKGTVSNHSISVTPSVTNTTGYIIGDTKTGTAVTVSASELVSGTKTISASGTTDVTNYASASVAAGTAKTPATTVTANPTISVSSGGLITASVSTTKSVTPTVTAGYVSGGTSGTITVSGSNTSQLTVQAAQTIHPSTTDQTITSGKYLTGTQTIKAVTTTNLTAANIAKDVVVMIGDSTDDDCVTSVTGTYEGGGGGSFTLGTFHATAASSTVQSFVKVLSFELFQAYATTYYPAYVNVHPSASGEICRWPISDDGYMYVTFIGANDKYTPSVTATSGTAQQVVSISASETFPRTGKAHSSECEIVYKVSVNAELSVTYYNNN